MKKTAVPPVASQEQWQVALKALNEKEEEAIRARDALAAERRRLPMVKIDKPYSFETPDQKVEFLDLFEGRRQLLLYHFMYHPNDDTFCVGCSMFIDQVGHLAHLHARDTSFAVVSRAPMASIMRHKKKMEWDIPWYSSKDSTFNFDFGVSKGDQDEPGLSVFFRDGTDIYRTYFTTGRGVELLGSTATLLDLTPWGRQENWEVSPEGWPQSEPFKWWKFHDEY